MVKSWSQHTKKVKSTPSYAVVEAIYQATPDTPPTAVVEAVFSQPKEVQAQHKAEMNAKLKRKVSTPADVVPSKRTKEDIVGESEDAESNDTSEQEASESESHNSELDEEDDAEGCQPEHSDDELDVDENTPLEKAIEETFKYLVSHDREELRELIDQFKVNVDDDHLELIDALEEVTETFLANEYDKEDMNETVTPVEKAIRALWETNLVKSSIQRFKMVVGDVYKNRYRVNSILSELQRPLEKHDAENI